MLLDDLKDYLGFAVAGNFANHLGEAGEADEFAQIKTNEKDAPKGMFPFYIKENDGFLGTYPISDEIILTHGREKDKLQVEAEVALICDFVYEDGKFIDIIPKYFSAFNLLVFCALRDTIVNITISRLRVIFFIRFGLIKKILIPILVANI